MTTLDLKLDMERIQSSVQASIRPAVEQALKGVDLTKYIAEALTRKKKKSDRSDFYLTYHSLMGYGGAPTYDCLLDQFIHEGISEIARTYVQQAIANQRDEIQLALAKSMRASQEKLTKMFVKSALDAVSAWEFTFNGSVDVGDDDDGSADDD